MEREGSQEINDDGKDVDGGNDDNGDDDDDGYRDHDDDQSLQGQLRKNTLQKIELLIEKLFAILFVYSMEMFHTMSLEIESLVI